MKKRLGRPSPAMLVACLALFVALTGSAVAAGIAKNSVGSAQLKKNAVLEAKIKADAVTGAKVKKDSLTGADVLESSLSTVPSAQSAQSAVTAQSAQTATTAQSVGSSRVVKIDYNAADGTGPDLAFDAGGLKLSGTCAGGMVLNASTTADNSVIRWTTGTYVNLAATTGTRSGYQEDDDFDVAESFSLLGVSNINTADTDDSAMTQFAYSNPAGSIITGTLIVEQASPFAGRSGVCHVIGQATVTG